MRWMLILPAALALGASASLADDSRAAREAREAAEHQAKIDAALKGLQPANKQMCINLHDTRDMVRAGDTVIYKVGAKRAYRMETSGGCFGLDRGDAFVTRTYSDQLCRGDIARTVDLVAGFETGSCTVGDFTLYKAN